jgi:putative ABC transport system permease protein
MPLLPRARSLWNTLRHRERLDRELDDELRAAIETLAARYEREGLDPQAARRVANRRLGGVERVRDEVRDGRIGAGLDGLLVDMRYAWRGLRASRGLAAVVVATLTLGIGATTAIFSVVHAMLVKPLPYADPDRLAFIWLDRNSTNPARTALGFPRGPMSGPDLRDLRVRTSSFAGVGAIWASGTIALTGDGDTEQLRGALVTTNFFDVLGAAPALGRTFRPEDALPGAEATVLLGWELFERRYGADRSIVGRRISVNEQRVTVIGVMPRDFRLLLPPDAAVPDRLQAFAPFWPDLESGPRRNLFLRVVARMRPGVTIAQARADVNAMSQAISRELPADRKFATEALQADDVREIRGPLLALFGGVGILLTIACVNVAGLLVARAAARRRETALRLALGASRSRLVRQSLVEGLLLTAAGAACGVFAGYAGLRLLLAFTPASLSRLEASRVDLTVLLFTLAVSAVWGLLFSLAPLAELFRTDPGRALTPYTRVTAAAVRYRTRAILVTMQVALSLVLLVGAGLLTRAFVQVLRVDPGFATDRHLTFRVLIPDHPDFVAFTSELQRRLAAIPGVTAVGSISHLPYDDLPNWGLPYSLESPIAPDSPGADARAITPGTFEALGVQLVEGRFFTYADRDQSRVVVIVDEMFARQTWPGASAIGKTFFTRLGDQRVTVVGVVRHLKIRSLVDSLLPQIFVPWAIAQRNPTAYVLRTSGDPMAIAARARTVVAGLDWRMAIYDVRPLASYVDAARSTRRFTVLLAAAFAAAALVLACVGVYGVIAYAVASRRHEFGVRRALGADAGRVMRSVLREGVAFAAAGAAIGIAGALAAGRLLQAQLYAVHPLDPWTFAGALALILGGAVVSCAIPAYRATLVSPMEALRTE